MGMNDQCEHDPALVSGRPMWCRFHILATLLIVTLSAIIYSNSLSGPFVFDDTNNIRDNTGLHWTSLSWSGVESAVWESVNWR